MMRALIVDDEPGARAELRALLEQSGTVVIAGEARTPSRRSHAVQRERPDVLFLDVQMPVVNGFELLAMMDEDVRRPWCS